MSAAHFVTEVKRRH